MSGRFAVNKQLVYSQYYEDKEEEEEEEEQQQNQQEWNHNKQNSNQQYQQGYNDQDYSTFNNNTVIDSSTPLAASQNSHYIKPENQVNGNQSASGLKNKRNKDSQLSHQQQKYQQQYNDDDTDNNPIQVMIRIRPAFNSEIPSAVRVVDSSTLLIQSNDIVHEFKFAKIFKPADSQEKLFNNVCCPVLQHAISGHNASFIVYGQTGTGKTHTMGLHQNNLEEEHGMVQQSLKYLFENLIHKKQKHHKQNERDDYDDNDDDNQSQEDSYESDSPQWEISISFMQIYIEEIFDLLNPNGQKLQIREDTETNEVYVQNLITVPVNSLEQSVKLIEAGLNYRMLGSQDMNSLSSRSHTILNIYLQQKITANEFILSTVAFVDLAGSERIKKSNSTGIRMEEAKKINSSLSVLSNVISSLGSTSKQFIPYRDSKLTRILQNSLTSSAKIAILGTIEPSEDNSFESYSTLLFASRCKDIQFLPAQNTSNVFTTLGPDLQDEVDQLKEKLKQTKSKLAKAEGTLQKIKVDTGNEKMVFARQILGALQKQYVKYVKRNSKKGKESEEQETLAIPRISFEELTELAAEGKQQEFVQVLDESFNLLFSHFSSLSEEIEKQQQREQGQQQSFDMVHSQQVQMQNYGNNNSISKEQQRQYFQHGSRNNTSQNISPEINQKLCEVIDFLQIGQCEAINQMVNLMDLEKNEKIILSTIETYQSQIDSKIKDILLKGSTIPAQSQQQPLIIKDILLSIDSNQKNNRKTENTLKSQHSRSEATLIVLQLMARLKQIQDNIRPQDQSSSASQSSHQPNQNPNPNIKNFLLNQKKINDQLYLPIKADINLKPINNSSDQQAQRLIDHKEYEDYNKHLNNSGTRTENNLKGSNSKDIQPSDGLQERSSSSSNTKANLKQIMEAIQHTNQKDNQKLISKQEDKGNSKTIKQSQVTAPPVTVMRLKILDSHIDTTELQTASKESFQSNKAMPSQTSSLNQQSYQPNSGVSSISPSKINPPQFSIQSGDSQQSRTRNSNSINEPIPQRSSVSAKKTKMLDIMQDNFTSQEGSQQFATKAMSPIPQEQQLNSQLKSSNFQKKNAKYSPFIDQ